ARASVAAQRRRARPDIWFLDRTPRHAPSPADLINILVYKCGLAIGNCSHAGRFARGRMSDENVRRTRVPPSFRGAPLGANPESGCDGTRFRFLLRKIGRAHV